MDEAAPPLAVDDALVADLLRAAFNSAPDGIVVVTNDGLLLTCNPAFIALWTFRPTCWRGAMRWKCGATPRG